MHFEKLFLLVTILIFIISPLYRMGLTEAAMTSGALLGPAVSSYLYAAIGYFYLFLICASLMALSVLYIFLFIKESERKQPLKVI